MSRSIVSLFWEKQLILPINGGPLLTLSGYSRAADRTCFYIKELKLFLDAGLSSYASPSHIFITHTHTDHSFNLPMLLTGSRDAKVYVPADSKDLISHFVKITFCLNENNLNAPYREDWYSLIGVEDGSVFDIVGKGKDLIVRSYLLDHTVTSFCFSFSEKRRRLNPKFEGMKGPELAKLRKDGEILDIIYEKELFVYVGDTSIQGLLRIEEKIANFPVVIVECTFLYEKDLGEGEDAKKHILWENLLPVIERNKNVYWILYHFSMRYSNEEILTFFKGFNLPNMHPWV